ncbi:MAG: hypothetical protein HC799_10260 [Limnothrix sp. RL_2_0]|nr:hypothetical protein [Limnothrix sp. RL_2_0]
MPDSNLLLLPGAVAEMLASVSQNKTLTLGDHYGLLAAALDETLPKEERLAVNRILRSVLRGKVHVTNKI